LAELLDISYYISVFMRLALFLAGMFTGLQLLIGQTGSQARAQDGIGLANQSKESGSDTVQINIIEEGINYRIDVPTDSSVRDALAVLGLSAQDGDIISQSPDAEISANENIFIDHATVISIIDDDVKREALTHANTVGGFITEQGIKLGELDIITPAEETSIKQKLTVKIKRRSLETTTEILDIPFDHIASDDPQNSYGKITIIKPGVLGKKSAAFEILKEDGRIIKKKMLSSTVLEKPQTQEELRGTKIVIGRVDEALGSWYNAFPGLYAASTTYPRKSFVRVTNLNNNKSVIVKINDYGPTIPGRIIDLEATAFKMLSPLYRGIIPVRVEQLL